MVADNLDYREGYKEWQLLRKHEEVTLGGFLAPDIYEKHRLTAEEKDQYLQDAGMKMRELVDRNYKMLDKLDALQLQKKLINYKGKAIEHAKNQIGKK